MNPNFKVLILCSIPDLSFEKFQFSEHGNGILALNSNSVSGVSKVENLTFLFKLICLVSYLEGVAAAAGPVSFIPVDLAPPGLLPNF